MKTCPRNSNLVEKLLVIVTQTHRSLTDEGRTVEVNENQLNRIQTENRKRRQNWKNLRDRFTREKREKPSGSGVPKSKWPHYKKMFYNKYTKPRRLVALRKVGFMNCLVKYFEFTVCSFIEPIRLHQ